MCKNTEFQEIQMKAKKMTVITLAVLMISISTHAVMFQNDIIDAFGSEEDLRKNEIEINIVDGACLFLQSEVNIDLLCYEYELSCKQQFDFKNALEYTEKAIFFLEGANSRYNSAKEIAVSTGYNSKKIDLFKIFDYEKFINEHKLNSDVAKKVKEFFSIGDIIGAFQKNIENISGILNLLYIVKGKLKDGIKPSKDLLWQLLQQKSECLMFGNYLTRIGSKILGV